MTEANQREHECSGGGETRDFSAWEGRSCRLDLHLYFCVSRRASVGRCNCPASHVFLDEGSFLRVSIACDVLPAIFLDIACFIPRVVAAFKDNQWFSRHPPCPRHHRRNA